MLPRFNLGGSLCSCAVGVGAVTRFNAQSQPFAHYFVSVLSVGHLANRDVYVRSLSSYYLIDI